MYLRSVTRMEHLSARVRRHPQHSCGVPHFVPRLVTIEVHGLDTETRFFPRYGGDGLAVSSEFPTFIHFIHMWLLTALFTSTAASRNKTIIFIYTPAVRSNILSKLVFASCVILRSRVLRVVCPH